MQKIFLSILFTFIITLTFSQVYKFRSSTFQMKTKDSNGWSKWTEPNESDILLVFNITKLRITIFSKKDQVYDIYKRYEQQTDSDGDLTFEYSCVDEEGLKCHVRWVRLNSQNGRLQIYVDFSDVMWMYNVALLE